MNCCEVMESDYAIEFAERFSNRGFASDIIARSKNMGGIKADTYPLRFTYAAYNVPQVFELISEARALTSKIGRAHV